ncbi:MAG: hypothetical protein K5894_06385 [Lachnospiraceae bacterium]|nr:hypothetical protein [Lachnospiraceae bacterium]
MRFAKNLYYGESLGRGKKLLTWKIAHGLSVFSAYLIVLPREGKDPLEIYHNTVVKQKYYRKHPPYVVGIAGSFEEAAYLTWEIMSDAKSATGEYDLWRYFGMKGERYNDNFNCS